MQRPARCAIDDEKRERDALSQAGKQTEPLPAAHFLAISGGGDSGAFAAGLLIGWSIQGPRPEFKAVTGISAGALNRALCLPRPPYNQVLREVTTSVSQDSFFGKRGLLAGLSSDGMSHSEPLAQGASDRRAAVIQMA